MKAVFVIDIDEDKIGNEMNHVSIGDSVMVIPANSRVKLKPLPQEREFGKQNILPIKVDGNSFALGWNACLKEIKK